MLFTPKVCPYHLRVNEINKTIEYLHKTLNSMQKEKISNKRNKRGSMVSFFFVFFLDTIFVRSYEPKIFILIGF